jgi:CRISPR-associated protein Cas1
MDECLGNLRTTLRNIHNADNVEELRGYEGHAARTTFSGYRLLFRKEVPECLLFTSRSRRPPRDRFNALLGFGYALLFQNVHQAILNVGLDPVLGFFHTARSAAPPLVLDVMELFRLMLWDIPLIGSINRLSWDPEGDFSVLKDRVWLSDTGRKKAISLFEERLMETWKHPVTKYSLSYERLLELETRLLEKEWSGKPGLFARMRLR